MARTFTIQQHYIEADEQGFSFPSDIRTFKDEDGLIRFKSHVKSSVLPAETHTPIMIHKDHKIAFMLVREAHEINGHLPAGYLFSALRTRNSNILTDRPSMHHVDSGSEVSRDRSNVLTRETCLPVKDPQTPQCVISEKLVVTHSFFLASFTTYSKLNTILIDTQQLNFDGLRRQMEEMQLQLGLLEEKNKALTHKTGKLEAMNKVLKETLTAEAKKNAPTIGTNNIEDTQIQEFVAWANIMPSIHQLGTAPAQFQLRTGNINGNLELKMEDDRMTLHSRNDLKVTFKIFMTKWEVESIEKAIEALKEKLKIKDIEVI
ncbi:Protein CBG08918 [Caenorhabditis briggsae]|uniref:Protein CBG08918 n=1 Tax=Caenorhabditis briggsae TaxID=6238 RepID=A8X7P4_CAEBR|nr:Protein CBG08918 [Caenorhabditis briggsae]CAP28655.1 Protein CBG08918 [Caenorhabditis briggsae]